MNLLSRLTIGVLCGCASMHSAARVAPPVDANPFIGVNVSSARADYDVIASDSAIGRGINIGLLFSDSRLYASLDFHEWDDAGSIVIRTNYDRLFSLHNRMTAFVGVNGSLVDFELAERYQPKKFDTGPGVGVQAGLVFTLSNRWALESGVRYDRFWVSSKVRDEAQSVDQIGLRTTALGYVNLTYISW